MTKIIDPNNFTVDAMVIYDILVEKCLYQLMEQKIPMDSSYIAKLVREYHPDKAYDVKTRFTKQKELITRLSLHVTDNCVGESDV
jgi:hypothetical protein